jgi:hypothetical protein
MMVAGKEKEKNLIKEGIYKLKISITSSGLQLAIFWLVA